MNTFDKLCIWGIVVLISIFAIVMVATKQPASASSNDERVVMSERLFQLYKQEKETHDVEIYIKFSAGAAYEYVQGHPNEIGLDYICLLLPKDFGRPKSENKCIPMVNILTYSMFNVDK